MKSKKENIAEYILYLWQLEDYLRAFPEQAEDHEELRQILDMMHADDVIDGGHIQLAQIALKELELLSEDISRQEPSYQAALQQLTPVLNIFKARTDRPTMSHIEAALVFLYQIMMLRLQKQVISEDTQQVQKQVTQLLQYLSKTYYMQDDLIAQEEAAMSEEGNDSLLS